MTGSRNDGGAFLRFFALDSEGQLWRGEGTDVDEPVWTKMKGPLADPPGS